MKSQVLFLAMACAAANLSAATHEISWHVVNRFPVLTQDQDFQDLENSWKGRKSAVEWVSSPQLHERLRNVLHIKRTAWVPDRGEYDADILFRTVKSTASIDPPVSGSCEWSIDGKKWPARPCAEPIQFEVPDEKLFNLSVTRSDGAAWSLRDQKISRHVIIGLGDSFASGEGNPDWATQFQKNPKTSPAWFYGKDEPSKYIQHSAEWWDVACHRSFLSWQALYAMNLAINSPHSAVRFASFSCSGAEIYDGFFRAQADPPGGDVVGTEGIFPPDHRDGGQGYKTDRHTPYEDSPTDVGQVYTRRLKHSQFNALAQFLCMDKIPKGAYEKVQWRTPQPGLASSQNYYGSVRLAKCEKSRLRKVDQVLLAFGGNDVNFSRVVEWGILPATTQDNKKKFFIKVGVRIQRLFSDASSPEEAAKQLPELDALYADLSAALTRLGIGQKNIYALTYPDPLDAQCNQECLNRNRDGFLPVTQLLHEEGLLAESSWIGNLSDARVSRIRDHFIVPLQSSQLKNFKKLGWNVVEGNQGFLLADGSRRTLCAMKCQTGKCPYAESLVWSAKPYAVVLPYSQLSDFDPYDPNRTRGLRYASDALLTQARSEPRNPGQLLPDWLFGTAHPTISVHASIAESMNAAKSHKFMAANAAQDLD